MLQDWNLIYFLQVVEIYICGVKPKDEDIEWTTKASVWVYNLISGRELNGTIVLRLVDWLPLGGPGGACDHNQFTPPWGGPQVEHVTTTGLLPLGTPGGACDHNQFTPPRGPRWSMWPQPVYSPSGAPGRACDHNQFTPPRGPSLGTTLWL
jgi:hypothetical protein